MDQVSDIDQDIEDDRLIIISHLPDIIASQYQAKNIKAEYNVTSRYGHTYPNHKNRHNNSL